MKFYAKCNSTAREIRDAVLDDDGTTREVYGPHLNRQFVAIHGYRESFSDPKVAAVLADGQWIEIVDGDSGYRDGILAVSDETPEEEQERMDQEGRDEAREAEAAYVYEYGDHWQRVLFEANESQRKFLHEV